MDIDKTGASYYGKQALHYFSTKGDKAIVTLLHWSPEDQHFMTATTAPRLRMANGFKIWHYTGTSLYKRPWNKREELWKVLWQRFPVNSFPEQAISYKAVEGIALSAPQASKQVYRYPSARGRTINF
ncbi:eukaryotic translation initiation factor 2A-like [Cotesia typhae]|uniref:eukaryotic translation initiation factor 2A-like n=1 Tax=Cotesia typhae TaxID=2053667 RepID=UPI003D69C806